MAQTVVGIFDDPKAAQDAAGRLHASGFSESDVDITNKANWQQDSGRKGAPDSSDDFGDRVGRFFKNLFDDDQEVKQYSTLANSGTVVSVYASSHDEAVRAAEILDQFGAIDVNERAAGTAAPGSKKHASPTNAGRDSDRSIPVIEEDVRVGKREVETGGGMRLRSRIIERPVQENLRLRTEHVSVDRKPANRPATESDMKAFREGEIEVREKAEVPVVDKTARVVEEVHVNKNAQERNEVVRDTARKSDVKVEQVNQQSKDRHDSSRDNKPGR